MPYRASGRPCAWSGVSCTTVELPHHGRSGTGPGVDSFECFFGIANLFAVYCAVLSGYLCCNPRLFTELPEGRKIEVLAGVFGFQLRRIVDRTCGGVSRLFFRDIRLFGEPTEHGTLPRMVRRVSEWYAWYFAWRTIVLYCCLGGASTSTCALVTSRRGIVMIFCTSGTCFVSW